MKRMLAVHYAIAAMVMAAIATNNIQRVRANAPKVRPIATEICNEQDGTCINTAYLDDCGIWLAPSTLKGAGLGIYAGRDFQKGEYMMGGDIVIPIVDIMMHQRGRGKFTFLWDEYTWNGRSLGMGHEVIKEVNAASPGTVNNIVILFVSNESQHLPHYFVHYFISIVGFGAAANCFLDLVNVEEGDPTNTMPNGLHRSSDPGVGAFTTYHDRKSNAKIDINAGQELFVNYGQHWFEQRIRLGPIPLRKGLQQSTSFYRKFQALKRAHREVDGKIYNDLWDTFVRNTVYNESRTIGAFWHTELEKEWLEQNKTLNEIRKEETTRGTDWLRQYGNCADHIREEPSTIRQAGRGAFATRAVPKGAVLAPLPIIQIVDKTVLEMYELADIKAKKREDRRIAGYQLLTNYCFGHQNSTMVLCPYGTVASLVNHHQKKANVKLQWADPKRGNHNPELLNVPISEFASQRTAALAMDFVALRDIEPDEEIFLDYGDTFEAAWQNHVSNWNIKDGDKYVSSFMLNEENIEELRTEFEQQHDPYPGNLNIECDHGIWKGIDQVLFETKSEINVTDPEKRDWWVCDLLRRRRVDGVIRYTAVATRPDPKKKKKTEAAKKDETPKPKYVKLTDIPRMAIRFTDRPYTSDMFLKQAFRHHIGIPDEIFPDAWKNFSPSQK